MHAKWGTKSCLRRYLDDMVQSSLNIYSYSDWQAFLRDWMELRRCSDPSVTLQSMAFRLGLNARSHMHRLLYKPGKTLAGHLVEPLAKLMGLNSAEADYWDAMVAMSRAKKPDDRNRHYLRMFKLQATRKPSDMSPSLAEYFGHWYLPVLREAVTLEGWNNEPARLARWLDPAVAESQVRRGIELLLKLGLLQRREDGRLVQVDSVLNTKSHARELAVTGFQREMIQLGERALITIDASSREVSSLTFSMPRALFPRIQGIVMEFQERLANELLAAEGTHDSVYQLNLQCFPVARKLGKEGT